MTSTYHHLAQARVALITLPDAPHETLCASHAAALEELRAAVLETEKLARVHPFTMIKEAVLGGLSAFSLLSIFVLGRTLAATYLHLQGQIANVNIPFVDVRGEAAKILPSVPMLEQLARLPQITWQQAAIGSAVVVGVILLVHILRTFWMLRRERLLDRGAREHLAAARVLHAAAAAPGREEALSLIAKGMADAVK